MTKFRLTAPTLLPAALALALGATAAPAQEAAPADPYADRDTTWVLVMLDTVPFEATATLRFPQDGQVAGKAVCNNYSGPQDGDFPEFRTGVLMATRMACPDMAQEQVFLDALADMRLAARKDGMLILSDGGDRQMVFTAAE
ncbi:META domain-containing protein [Marinibacterium sp. SX1]|uniref:META domain-containing protein n=1 Tax=Marinibacterium sp. SX1 TaxID=3388424 RepID=UPI003D17743D